MYISSCLLSKKSFTSYPSRGSPFVILSLRYESNISVDSDVVKAKYWRLTFESSVLTIIRIGLRIHIHFWFSF